jgi:hypothetical protein
LAVSDLLGSKERIRNLEAGQAKEVPQQGDPCYEDNPKLKLPSKEMRPRLKIMFTAAAEFKHQSVSLLSKFFEIRTDGFAKPVRLFDCYA